MLYDIGLKISYEYEHPANAGRHVLRLMPAELFGTQRVVWGALDIDPEPTERMPMSDFFGNRATEIAFRHDHEEITFSIKARVERTGAPPVLDMSPSLTGLAEEIASVTSLDKDAPHHFLGVSPRVHPVPDMTEYALSQIGSGMTVLQIVTAIGLALNRDITFDPEATDVDTPPEEAFARRHGVCQDMSHIMIAMLRGLDIPAGYVSGFLRTKPPKGQPRLEGADAMHAWVRAWCGAQTGWVEYDPTNAITVGTDHIVIAHGRDYGDVAPVRGVMRVAGSQTSTQAVDVIPLD